MKQPMKETPKPEFTINQEVKLQIIQNYIDWVYSDEAERTVYKDSAIEYVAEDHVDEIEQNFDSIMDAKLEELLGSSDALENAEDYKPPVIKQIVIGDVEKTSFGLEGHIVLDNTGNEIAIYNIKSGGEIKLNIQILQKDCKGKENGFVSIHLTQQERIALIEALLK